MHPSILRRRAVVLAVLPALALTACSRSNVKEVAPQASGTPSAGGQAPNADFGSLKSVCGPGSGTKGTTTGQGLTADSIQVGVISDVGFPGQPGLNHELNDVADVFSKWCNDNGGINGRKIKIVKRDAAVLNVKKVMTQACAADFVLAGGFAVQDGQVIKDRLKCLLPDFPGAAVDATVRGADLTFQTNPSESNSAVLGVYDYFKKKYPGSQNAMGFLTANISNFATIHDQNAEAVKKLGYKIVYDQQYNSSGESSYLPFAQAMKSKGVKVLGWLGGLEQLAPLEQAMKQINYYPDAILGTVAGYDNKWLALAPGAVKNTYEAGGTLPFTSTSPAMTKYLDLFKHYDSSVDPTSSLGVLSFGAWLLFAKSASACGANLTRACLVEKALAVTSWDAGGLHGPANPAKSASSPCYSLEVSTGDHLQAVSDFGATEGPFNCSPDNIVRLSGKYGTPATLASVGKRLSDLK